AHITITAQLYAAVRQHSAAGETIFGENDIIPLVASETDRRIAANLVDTSSYRLSFGLSRMEDWIAAIEADHVKLLVVRPGQTPMRHPQFRDYALQHFARAARLQDPLYGEFLVMRRKE